MNHLLLLAAVQNFSLPDATHIAFYIASFALGLARLMDTGRPIWSVGGLVPQRFQPPLIALVAVLPDIATGMGLVHTNLDLANAILAGVGSYFTALRGQLPDHHLAALDPVSQKAVAAVRAGDDPPTPRPPVGTAMLMLVAFVLTGCNGTIAKDVESALSWIAKVEMYANDAATYLQQNEAKIVSLAPSSVRDALQADLDKAMADYREALKLTGDGTNITEDALAKNWATFVTDTEKLTSDAEQAGLFKAPAAASSNAVPAGASPAAPPQDSPPPLPLIVRHLRGQG